VARHSIAKSKLYTRAGDKGLTSLFGGKRVPKDNLRIEAYGQIDELNSAIGVAASFLRRRTLVRLLQSVQNELFNIGAELASPNKRKAASSQMFRLPVEKVVQLEKWIDEYDAKIPPLKTFILPSGDNAATLLHLARTICRRAERAAVTLAGNEEVNPQIIAYLNRLSDLLFALARYVNKVEKRQELPWKKG